MTLYVHSVSDDYAKGEREQICQRGNQWLHVCATMLSDATGGKGAPARGPGPLPRSGTIGSLPYLLHEVLGSADAVSSLLNQYVLPQKGSTCDTEGKFLTISAGSCHVSCLVIQVPIHHQAIAPN